jgi:succinate dehydrogenase/fumarate reductase flavoprotein subunit
MKTMTCKQLGGACEKAFQAETFEKIAELSKQHGMEMFKQGDEAHLKAMQEMKEVMQNPEAMKEWMETKKKMFDSLPDDVENR